MGQVLLGKAVEEDAEVLPFLVEGAPESTKLGNCATAISLSTRVLLTTSSPHLSLGLIEAFAMITLALFGVTVWIFLWWLIKKTWEWTH